MSSQRFVVAPAGRFHGSGTNLLALTDIQRIQNQPEATKHSTLKKGGKKQTQKNAANMEEVEVSARDPEPTPALGRNLESEPTGIGKGNNGSIVQKWLDQALNQKIHEKGPEPTALVLFLHTGALLWSLMMKQRGFLASCVHMTDLNVWRGKY